MTMTKGKILMISTLAVAIIISSLILILSEKPKHKIITQNYNTEQVPSSVHYTEYIDGEWYVGELNLQGSSNYLAYDIWQATYEGKLYR